MPKRRGISEKERNRLKRMSLENAERWKAKRIKTVCAYCGEKIEIIQSVYNINGNFCSKRCSNIFHSKAIGEKLKGKKKSEATKEKLRKYTGEKASGWKGGKPKCKICGKGIGYGATYCMKHKHLLWTKEKWEKLRETSRSIKKVGIMPKNLNYPLTNKHKPFGNIKRGYYNINGIEIFFRSKMEANYALYLDFLIKQKQIKKWEYEPDVFIFSKIKFGTRSYRPDFKVYNLDETISYHETKGYMDTRSKTKIKRMAKYYPNVKLIIIGSPVYNDLKKKLGKMLKFY